MPTPTRWPERYTVDAQTGCWVWSGRLEYDGYARVSVDGSNVMAHRYIYELLQGPVPDDMEMDHLCRNHSCVNPGHLEPVTTAENQRCGNATKLNWDKVRFIRAFYQPYHREFGTRALARMFEVSPEAVRKIVHHISWVDDPAIEGGQ